MKVIEPGHIYELDWIDTDEKPYAKGKIVFVNREDNPHAGTQTQEVLRVLIDRTMHCDNCLPDPIDDAIIYHMRMALILHEARALVRKVEKGLIEPENIGVGPDGHFDLMLTSPTEDSQNWVGRDRRRQAIRDSLREDAAEKLHGVQREAFDSPEQPGGSARRSNQ